MDYDADGRLDGERGGVRDAVGDVDEFHFEGAQFDHVTGLDFAQVGMLDLLVLAQLALDEPQCQAHPDDDPLQLSAQQPQS